MVRIKIFVYLFTKFYLISAKVTRWKEHPAYNTMTVALGWTYCHFFLPHCFLPFPLLFVDRYIKAYASLFFIEYLFFAAWPLWGKLVKGWLLSENKKVNKETGDSKNIEPKNDSAKKQE